MGLTTRATLVEYAASAAVLSDLALAIGLDRAVVRDQILTSGERIAKALELSTNPIEVVASGLSVRGIAGLLRVGTRLELEIAPKFLGTAWSGWREDFFFISMLSRHGCLLTNERIGSAIGAKQDLATLVGRAMITMFWENHRRPLRTYRNMQFVDFAIEGDVDAESILLPEVAGYEQRFVTYDQNNVFNATILSATQALLPEVREPQTRSQLMRMAQMLTPQAQIRRIKHRRVPSRARRWQSLHDLAVDVLNGFGMAYAAGRLRAPGFIVDTWRIWEDLVTIAIRSAWGMGMVAAQQSAPLGVRTYFDDSRKASTKTAWVTPDLTMSDSGRLLVDAKYKSRFDDLRNRISEVDLYEALAFATATKCNRISLFYPALPRSDGDSLTGACAIFEEVSVGDVLVLGVEVEVRGISNVGGFRRFSDGVGEGLRTILSH